MMLDNILYSHSVSCYTLGNPAYVQVCKTYIYMPFCWGFFKLNICSGIILSLLISNSSLTFCQALSYSHDTFLFSWQFHILMTLSYSHDTFLFSWNFPILRILSYSHDTLTLCYYHDTFLFSWYFPILMIISYS